MPYRTEHSARMIDPDLVSSYFSEPFMRGVRFIRGRLSSGQAVIQAVRFHVDQFTVTEAKAWLKQYGMRPILFETALEDGKVDVGLEKLAAFNRRFAK